MTVHFGSGVGGGYYTVPTYTNTTDIIVYPQTSGGGTYVGGSGTINPGACITTPFTNTRNSRLTEKQLAFLLDEHRFMDMNDGEYCLFCFALDVYRTRREHIYVIREE